MTVRLALLRHGPTAWSRAKRIQGSSDQPLDHEGRREVMRWRLPDELIAIDWVSSPLARARETASRLAASHRHGGAILIEPLLAEMDQGRWEGERLDDLRRRLGDEMAGLEARGLDYRAPEGESPREVQRRLRPWLARIAGGGSDILAVSHKGVIRALYAQASGWDMRAKPPVKLQDPAVHLFAVGTDGRLEIERLNLALLPSAADAGAADPRSTAPGSGR